MGNLERAIEIAAAAHAGQTDKAGAPYISHPLRVALGFIRARDEERAIIAVLHDVIEDSAITATDLRGEGFSKAIVEAVEALTRPEGEPYREFILRAAANELAKPVKVADLKDNLSHARLAMMPTDERSELLAKYEGALEVLGAA